MHKDVVIRRMDMSDVPFVYREEKRVFQQRLEEKALYEEIIENNHSRYYIALLDGKRIGYIGGWIPRPNAEVITVFVKEKYRHQHIGQELLAFLLDVFTKEEVESVTLEVRRTNNPAISLYRSFGFEQVAVRKNYYKDGEDALMMYLLLGGQV